MIKFQQWTRREPNPDHKYFLTVSILPLPTLSARKHFLHPLAQLIYLLLKDMQPIEEFFQILRPRFHSPIYGIHRSSHILLANVLSQMTYLLLSSPIFLLIFVQALIINL